MGEETGEVHIMKDFQCQPRREGIAFRRRGVHLEQLLWLQKRSGLEKAEVEAAGPIKMLL